MAILKSANQYKYSGKGPLDSKALVKTYSELFDVATWTLDDKIIAYNGMVTAVWLNKDDTSKNGVYFLHDPNCTSNLKTPDVTNKENWHKLGGSDDLQGLSEQIAYVQNDLAQTQSNIELVINAITGEVAKKANATDVYTITQADSKFMTEAQVKAAVDKVVADAADTNKIVDLVTLVECVQEHSSDIVKLISNVQINTEAIALNKISTEKNASDIAAINDTIANIIQPRSSEEISVEEDGTLSINEMNVNKLVQTAEDTLILNGGNTET